MLQCNIIGNKSRSEGGSVAPARRPSINPSGTRMRQMQSIEAGSVVPRGALETCVVAVAADVGPSGQVPVAWVTASMNAAAEAVARRTARGPVVAVAMSKVTILTAVAAGDTLRCHADVVRFGTTSMTLCVEAWACGADAASPEKVTGAEYTFVAVDDDGRPRPVLVP